MRASASFGFLAVLLTAVAAAGWTPSNWVEEETLEICTVAPEEGEYCFPVWPVVLDNQIYVRLGSRAANRIERNLNAPYVHVKIAGLNFKHVRGQAAPEQAARVAAAIKEKYWSDVFVRYLAHPLTLRLAPDDPNAR